MERGARVSETLEFDFARAEEERHLTEHWERLERLAREEMSEENLCLAWVTHSDGRAWVDWWRALPNYTREGMLVAYRAERESADFQGQPMRPYRSPIPPSEVLEQEAALVNLIAADIREAALQRRPLPWKECNDMSGLEKLAFRTRLQMAFLEANVVVVAAA